MKFFLLLVMVLGMAKPVGGQTQEWIPKRIVGVEAYHRLALLARVQGTVKVKCWLDQNGSVVSSEVLSGHPLLAKTAQENALQWKFLKRSESDAAGQSNVTLVYNFRLSDPATRSRPRIKFEYEYPNSVVITSESVCADHIPCNEQEWKEFQRSRKEKRGQSIP